ncbi:ribosomal L3 [Pyrenophora seminiperda CCB06]|uniref:Ribosomal L3 n=1 Tax=Pyrenophora seminiperda CCB06 TaxID=1302712 RepID=A0A3M7MIM6_9PLEO|nr:ribosomal L3 [Pyrenophora seminiperda CCB06]
MSKLIQHLYRAGSQPVSITCTIEACRVVGPNKCNICKRKKPALDTSSNTTITLRQLPPYQTAHSLCTSVPRPRSHTSLRTVYLRTMSSDADYAAFLDKANQDVGSAETKDASQKQGYGTMSVNTAVPKMLEQVEEYYISDADEPFEPVALSFEGSSVSADDLKKLIGSDQVEEVKGTGFESQYKKVVDAVKQAGDGTVKVFRVELQGARAEYYVVTVDKNEGRLVGLKALAVES